MVSVDVKHNVYLLTSVFVAILYTIIGGSCYKYQFCRDKSFVTTNTCLSPQTRVYRDKTRLLSQQKYDCRDKIMFVAKKYFCFVATNICHDKHVFVATKVLSRQKLYLWQLAPVIGRWHTITTTTNNNVHLSCAHQRPEHSHSRY